MKYLFVNQEIHYDGSQLSPLFSYMKFKLAGNSIVAFVGSCEVKPELMVDAEDLTANQEIRSDKMLHFIVEIFDTSLYAAVILQRLMASISHAFFLERGLKMVRKGDDLYWSGKKFSISIASRSSVSSMIHFAMNMTNNGTPVSTCSFEDLSISAKEFADFLLVAVADEYESIIEATQKVKPL